MICVNKGFWCANKIIFLDLVGIWVDLFCGNCFCCTFMIYVLFQMYVTLIF